VWIRFYVASLKPLPGKSASRQAPAIMVSRLPGKWLEKTAGLSSRQAGECCCLQASSSAQVSGSSVHSGG